MGYTLASLVTADKIRPWHPILRPIIRNFIPEYRLVQRQLAIITRLIKPLVQERLQGKKLEVPNIIDWMMENSSVSKRQDVKYQGMQQLQVSFAAIHTTAKLLTNVVSDLAAHPEYIQPLRDELDAVLSENDGQLTKAALFKLKRQSSRYHGVQSGCYVFVEAFEWVGNSFSTYLAAASSQIAMDPQHWSNPEKYDGMRLHIMRQQPGSDSKFQFVSTSSDMLLFGYGSHAQFFANNEVKIILSHLIRNFDFALPNGRGRPKPVIYDVAFKPDPNQEILFKRRESLFT
ncbi:cytochrome P450 [Xylariaceae sp. FL0255]|nr:cytochrome P450 [Xylariaceae sp. FL0255]